MHKALLVALAALGGVVIARGAAGQEPPAPRKPPVDQKAPPQQPAAPPKGEPAAPPPTAPTPPTAPAEPEGTEQEPEAPVAPEEEPLPVEPPPAAAPPPVSPAGPGNIGIFPQPGAGPAASEAPAEKPVEQPEGADERIFAEDWWTHARPAFEIHGHFRVRAELFHNFSLSRVDPPNQALWPQPADNFYNASVGRGSFRGVGPQLCTGDEAGVSSNDDPNVDVDPTRPGPQMELCRNRSQAGANIRFRLTPELHISDNLRVLSQVDLLDNQVLGSTPSGASFVPGRGNAGGYEVRPRSGYAPVGVLDDTIVPPTSGVNSVEDSIRVERAWAEYETPLGELRFGRMPDHWGLGMVHNSGDGFDDDYQSTIDRIMFMTGLKPLDLFFGGAWDFPNEGPISESLPGGQPYDAAQLDDVNQWALILMHYKSPELVKLALSRGQLVLNGGAYVTLRKQVLANDQNGANADASSGANVPGAEPEALANNFSRRGATIWLPDLWLQLRYRKFRFEAEGAAVLGSIESTESEPGYDFGSSELTLQQYGLATELEQRLVEDRLSLQFKFGWASGDPDAFDPDNVGNLVPGPNEIQVNDDTDSTFRFHPNYRFDLILHRNLLSRVQGTYYFRPSVEYDFMRKPSGQRLGGGAAVIWSRASQFVQTPGHARDLGIELNGRLYFQSKDGSLNDEPGTMGGFFTMLEYGVLFPLGGLGYQDQEEQDLRRTGLSADTGAAQILRLYLGVIF